ncbi:Axin-1 like protein [Argiope bruennichi]|uniref:Axin-1 like protein n=1 Tax=Argiope bruennichi TaxID=94029 RepID=A0A8T0DZE4_ARGBR|nr:Axin-1 like protein [Argiope bruennichi]
MREDPFITILIEKLNNLKRDQEVRENLEDSLREFKNFQSKVLNKTRVYFSKKKQPQKSSEIKGILKKPKSKNSVPDEIAHSSTTHSVPKSNDSIRFKTPQKVVKDKKEDFTVVGYCIGGNPVPYSTKVRGKKITLGRFKTLFNRKGDFRFFFKRYCNEFGTNVVFEEINDDEEVLPLWDGKIFALVEEIEEHRL